MTASNDPTIYAIVLCEDRNAVTPLGQLDLPLVHISTARTLMFDWARERAGAFLRLDARLGHTEEWKRAEGWWHPVLLPPQEVGRAEPSR